MLQSFLRAQTAQGCLKDMFGFGGLAFLSTSAISVLRVSVVFWCVASVAAMMLKRNTWAIANVIQV